jgi:hypothetical protein
LSKQTSKQGIVKLNDNRIKITGSNRHLSILTLNVSGLNASIKRHRIAKRVKKQDPTI